MPRTVSIGEQDFERLIREDCFYGKKVIILLDEYDTPLQEAFVNGYWDEMVAFVRGLFNAAFRGKEVLIG